MRKTIKKDTAIIFQCVFLFSDMNYDSLYNNTFAFASTWKPQFYKQARK